LVTLPKHGTNKTVKTVNKTVKTANKTVKTANKTVKTAQQRSVTDVDLFQERDADHARVVVLGHAAHSEKTEFIEMINTTAVRQRER